VLLAPVAKEGSAMYGSVYEKLSEKGPCSHPGGGFPAPSLAPPFLISSSTSALAEFYQCDGDIMLTHDPILQPE
jgi:hypothetical protein